MKTSELRGRDGVLSATANQHGVTVVCRNHPTALGIQDEYGGEVDYDRHWTVHIPPDESDDG